MTKKRALGKGLGALIPTGEALAATPETREGGIRQVPASAIAPNPHQPRQHIDPQALDVDPEFSKCPFGACEPLDSTQRARVLEAMDWLVDNCNVDAESFVNRPGSTGDCFA